MIVPARRRLPRSNNYRRSGVWSGLGACTAADPSGCVGPYSNPMFNYDYQLNQAQSGGAQEQPAYTPPAQPINAVCQPWDSACVMRNVTQQTNYQQGVIDAVAANNLQRCLDNQTDPAECARRYPGVAPSGNVGVAVAPVVVPVPAVPVSAPAPAVAPAGASTTPQGAAVVTSSGAQNAPPVGWEGRSTSSGFSFSSIPTWGWLVAAGVAAFALKGKG